MLCVRGAVAVLKLLLTSVVFWYNNFLVCWMRVSVSDVVDSSLETVAISFLVSWLGGSEVVRPRHLSVGGR